MSRPKRSVKKVPLVESSSDDEDAVPIKKHKSTPVQDNIATKKNIKENGDDCSSSESDIENYLQPVDKLDFSSEFFNLRKSNEEEFDKIEKNIFEGIGVSRLSDSESDFDDSQPSVSTLEKKEVNQKEETNKNQKLNFQQLHEFTRQIEEAKTQVAKYNAKKKVQEKKLDISKILSTGESKQLTLENIRPEDLHPSDLETTDDEDWEEIKVKDEEEKNIVPKKDIQIQIGEMPEHCRKKKGIDLLAAMKRRLNRIRKENQIYVHKVHLLCWIAHGNFVNSVISESEILGLALSILPSDKCYPSDRINLSYLEQIVQWYKRTIKLIEKPPSKTYTLRDALKLQIDKKEVYEKKMLVLIFIALMRALGVQCRMVLSFQVEPLRPPSSELHSLSTKEVKAKEATSKSETLNKSKDTKLSASDKLGSKVNSNADKKPMKASIPKSGKEANNLRLKLNGTKTSKDAKKVENTQNKPKLGKLINKKESTNKSVTVDNNRKETNVRKLPKTTSKVNVSIKSQTSKSKDIKTKNVQTDTTKGRSDTKEDNKKSKIKNVANKKVNQTNSTKRITRGTKKENIENSTDNTEKDIPQLDGANDNKKRKTMGKPEKSKNKPAENSKNKSAEKTPHIKKRPVRLKASTNTSDSDSDFSSPERSPNLSKLSQRPSTSRFGSQLDVRNDIINLIKGRIAEQKYTDRGKMTNKRKPQNVNSDSDSDYMPEPIKKKHHNSDSDIEYFVPKPKVKKRVKVKRLGPGHPILSDSDDESKKKKKGNDIWLEVFLEDIETWISVDVIRAQVHCVNELYARATHPLSYVVAWNNDNTIKDVSRRYCKNFNTVTRKLRIDGNWWEETVQPFKEKPTPRSKEEDNDLNRQQLDQPLPKSISEFKNHPLYALSRHLLKFEVIYPPDAVPLGYVRGEPVYPRNCVHICRSRDIWLKEAKVVKPGEKPYKIVKARPKYDRISNTFTTDQLLEIFGEWQTVDYDPPTAENGIVPRNAFGNVELFKARMLPKGTVHLKLPGLNKVCKKLNIDCASAIVGFDFHGGWSHPVYDGFVVCEEFTDTCIAAWEMDQEQMEAKENEKIEKRVYTNWKKLIKGLLIRERLKNRYDFGGEASTSTKGKKTSTNTKSRKKT